MSTSTSPLQLLNQLYTFARPRRASSIFYCPPEAFASVGDEVAPVPRQPPFAARDEWENELRQSGVLGDERWRVRQLDDPSKPGQRLAQ